MCISIPTNTLVLTRYKPLKMGCCSSNPVQAPISQQSAPAPTPAPNPQAPLAPPANPPPTGTSPIIIGKKPEEKIPFLDLSNTIDRSSTLENLNTVDREIKENLNTDDKRQLNIEKKEPEENFDNNERKEPEENFNDNEKEEEKEDNLNNEESYLENKCNSLTTTFSKCPEGHTFNWRSDLVYWQMKNASLSNSSPIHIQCDNCFRIFSKPGWQCQRCDSILCETCGSDSYQKTVLKCKKNHELIWCIDSWALNIDTNRSTKSSIACNICHKSYQEPAFVCRDCNYYSCISCSINQGVNPPNNLLVCENKHLLTLQKAQNVAGPCRICNKNLSGNCYNCNACEYPICQLCGIKNTLKMLRHPGIRCKNSHPTMVLNDFRNMPKTHKYHCLACYKHGFKFGMFCVFCGEAYCLQCSDKLQTYLENFIGKRLGEESIIEWYGIADIGQEEKFACSNCNKTDNEGIYFRDQANKYCVDCVSLLN